MDWIIRTLTFAPGEYRTPDHQLQNLGAITREQAVAAYAAVRAASPSYVQVTLYRPRKDGCGRREKEARGTAVSAA